MMTGFLFHLGIVFENVNDDPEALPSNIRYKIRMEVGRVDGTAKGKVKWRCVILNECLFLV